MQLARDGRRLLTLPDVKRAAAAVGGAAAHEVTVEFLEMAMCLWASTFYFGAPRAHAPLSKRPRARRERVRAWPHPAASQRARTRRRGTTARARAARAIGLCACLKRVGTSAGAPTPPRGPMRRRS